MDNPIDSGCEKNPEIDFLEKYLKIETVLLLCMAGDS
jgi:hypothetical protein